MEESSSTLSLASAYFPARSIPAVVNLVALAVYTRLLDPSSYGRYGIVLAVVNLFQALCFRWLRLALLRYYEEARRNGSLAGILSTVWASYAAIGLFSSVLWVLAVRVVQIDPSLRGPLMLGLAVLLAQAAFEIVLTVQMATLRPKRYGIYTLIRAVLSLAVSVACVTLLGLGENGLILGLAVSCGPALLWEMTASKGQLQIGRVERGIGVRLFRYGLPLTLALALGLIVAASDRYMLGRFLGEGSAGYFTASSDLANQSVTLLFVVVGMAVYPLSITALTRGGELAAKAQLREGLAILLLPTLPAVAGLSILAKPLSAAVFGKAFQTASARLLPWMALIALLAGIRAYYFDLAFQLGERTRRQIVPIGAVAILNLLLNVLLIPGYGALGAAYGTVIAHSIGLLMSYTMGRPVFAMPIPWGDIARILICVAMMSAVLLIWPNSEGWLMIIARIILGVGIYGCALLAMNPNRIRRRFIASMRAWRRS
jgi:O-antigen/teichoic acid export membrane protein